MDRIDINNLAEELYQQVQNEKDKLAQVFSECREALINNTDTAKAESLLSNYEIACYRFDRAKDLNIKSHISAAELFNKMAGGIDREFPNTEVDTENFTISFPWFGNSINWPVKMLANMYNLSPSMFGFDSSFTTHEAYTEDNYRITIGISQEDNTIVVINFGKLNKIN